MQLPRPHLPILDALVVLAGPATGCGSSDEQTPTATAPTPAAPPGASVRACEDTAAAIAQLRVTGVSCEAGGRVMASWTGKPACSNPTGASRYSCSVAGYRCLGATTDSGVAVSCGRPGSSVAFIAKRG